MNFTLYIDESGDFETHRGEWVLSGMLFAESINNCEKQLTDKLRLMPQELGLRSMKDFHLTEFRRDFGHDIAVSMADKTLRKLDKLPFDYYCLATINETKSALSNREKTYRLMLSDILALCDTAIGENQKITNLDLVVATRTIDGELQTTLTNIDQEIIRTLPIALEVDLATKGMVDLIGKHINVTMDYANNSWGLICADFLANLNYHYKKDKEKKLLGELANKGRYSLFESFGGYEIRRANIAERDHDYVLALFRWIIIQHRGLKHSHVQESIQRVLFKLLNKKGTSGSTIGFESVLERLWRQYNNINNYTELSQLLRIFEEHLLTFKNGDVSSNVDSYLFRLRNLKLIIDNHLGNTDVAFESVSLQRETITELVSNPEHFQMILDFYIAEIEVYINALDFKQALKLSESYYALIQSYKDVWQLLLDTSDKGAFDTSRASIKAEMTLLRSQVLLAGLAGFSLTVELSEGFLRLEKRLTNNIDKSRYHNYKVMFLLKQNKYREAVSLVTNKMVGNKGNTLSFFDFFWFLKSVNDSLLHKVDIDIKLVAEVVDEQIANIDLNMKGHPVDLIFRELSLFFYQSNNKSLALKYIRRSKNSFDLAESNIGKWLKLLINIHEDHVLGKVKSEDEYFEPLRDHLFINQLSKTDEQFLLNKVRCFSPY